VTEVSSAVGAPVRKLSGISTATKEALKTFKARRAAGRPDTDITASRPVVTVAGPPPAGPAPAAPAEPRHRPESPYPTGPAAPPAGPPAA
jgi:hypothetical protein